MCLICSVDWLFSPAYLPLICIPFSVHRKRPFTVRNEELEKPSGIYKYAAFMGAKSLNQATCDALFKACPMPGDQMVSVWRSVVELVPSMLNTMKPGKFGK